MTDILVNIICIFLLIAAVYLLMIMPRMSNFEARKPFVRHKFFAHRGLHNNDGDNPENSMKAFRMAVEAGFGIELDVQRTKDGVPVIFHDFTLDRMCHREGRLDTFTYEELQELRLGNSDERIPRLDEFLEMVNGRVPLIVEFKIDNTDMTLCTIVDKMLRDYKGLYCIECFNSFPVMWFRRHHKEVVRGQLADAFIRTREYTKPLFFFVQNLLFNCLSKPDFVAYNHLNENVLSRRLCRNLFKNTAAAWTIQSSEDLLTAKDQFDIFIFDSFIPSDAEIQMLKGEE